MAATRNRILSHYDCNDYQTPKALVNVTRIGVRI